MHHYQCKSLSNLFTCYSARLTEEDDERNVLGSDIQNTNFKRDSVEGKGCNQCKCPCTACPDGLNCVILRHKEGIRWTSYQCLLDTILELARCDSWLWQAYRPPCIRIPSYTAPGTYQTVKLRYGIDIRVKSGPLQCIRHFKITSTLYVRLLTQPYNSLYSKPCICIALVCAFRANHVYAFQTM